MALEYIRETPDISNEEKKRFFKSANTNLGTSALCLSGGASFGYCGYTQGIHDAAHEIDLLYFLHTDHFGVVKAFLDQNLLPRVISGTSAGGLVAALVCTRTDEELKELLVPELADRITACEDPFQVWFERFWTTGARFDSATWARKVSSVVDAVTKGGLLTDLTMIRQACFFTRGSMTFREAYMRTGRILNVSVIPAERHSYVRLLIPCGC